MKRFILITVILAAAAAVPTLPQAPSGRLADVIKDGKRAAAFAMIQAGADVNAAQPDGSRPILWAVYRVDYDLVQALIAKKAKVDVANEFGYTPLAEAVRQGDARMVKILMDAGSGTEAPNLDGQTALMTAIKNGDLPIFQMLIDAGAKVNVVEKAQEQTPLMWAAAAQRNAADMVKVLIAKGANVSARAKFNDWPAQITSEPRAQYHAYGGLTPLLYAARGGCYVCVEALVAAGADVNLPTPEGVSPMMVALDNNQNGVAKFLMDRGGNPHVWDAQGRTALYIAVGNAGGGGGGAGAAPGGRGGAPGGAPGGRGGAPGAAPGGAGGGRGGAPGAAPGGAPGGGRGAGVPQAPGAAAPGGPQAAVAAPAAGGQGGQGGQGAQGGRGAAGAPQVAAAGQGGRGAGAPGAAAPGGRGGAPGAAPGAGGGQGRGGGQGGRGQGGGQGAIPGGPGGGGRGAGGGGPQVSGLEMVNILLNAGVDPNPQLNMRRPSNQGGRFSDPLLSTGTTPLHRALIGNNQDVARLLLEKGASPNIFAMGISPWLYATGITSGTYNEGGGGRGGGGGGATVNTQLLDLMLKHGADLNAQVTGAATYSGRIARALTGDPINTKSAEGMTALHVAVRTQNTALVRYLLDKGARVDILDVAGRTPLDILNGVTGLVPAVFADGEGVVSREATAAAAAAAPAPAGGRGGAAGGAGGRGGNPAAVQEIRTLLQSAAQKQA